MRGGESPEPRGSEVPSKAKPTPAAPSEDAIRQRAYLMWEADGKPDGMSDHYWHRASQAPDESAKSKVKATAAKAAAALKGGNPAETRPTKATASKLKVAAAKVAAPAVKAKPAAKTKTKKKD